MIAMKKFLKHAWSRVALSDPVISELRVTSLSDSRKGVANFLSPDSVAWIA